MARSRIAGHEHIRCDGIAHQALDGELANMPAGFEDNRPAAPDGSMGSNNLSFS
jgi:hypothetical protein